MKNGRMHRDQMWRARAQEDRIRASSRRMHGLTRMEQVRHAILGVEGHIPIAPTTPRSVG